MASRVSLAASLLALVSIAGLAACGGDGGSEAPGGALSTRDAGPDASESDGGGDGGDPDGGTGSWPGASQVCYLLNCTADAECQGCTLGRTHCDAATQRCLACDPKANTGCPSGQSCTQYGTCVAQGVACPVDGAGEPMITCQQDADCAACDTSHQACDASTKKCVQCGATNKSACKPNEVCFSGVCEARCPSACTSNADCAQCDNGIDAAHACNLKTGTCAECSPTVPCPGNQVCSAQGSCVASCGRVGQPKGACQTDADCSGCATQAGACHQPINGGWGKCGPPASGCSDLGNGALAIPPPWDAATNTCSNDMDCQNTGLALNVGKLLRDITGVEQIRDATLQYGMNSCAAIELAGVSCGVCVPCKTDADCKPVDLDPLVSQMLGPLGPLAEKFILDQAFGSSDHHLYMYCDPVAGDYGVCAPCSDPTKSCGVGQTTGSQCANSWECSWNETCDGGQCKSTEAAGCTKDVDCGAGQVCGWNGTTKTYCCQAPGPMQSSTCFADSDCTVPGQSCIWNGQHFYCNTPQCQ